MINLFSPCQEAKEVTPLRWRISRKACMNKWESVSKSLFSLSPSQKSKTLFSFNKNDPNKMINFDLSDVSSDKKKIAVERKRDLP